MFNKLGCCCLFAVTSWRHRQAFGDGGRDIAEKHRLSFDGDDVAYAAPLEIVFAVTVSIAPNVVVHGVHATYMSVVYLHHLFLDAGRWIVDHIAILLFLLTSYSSLLPYLPTIPHRACIPSSPVLFCLILFCTSFGSSP